MTFPDRLMLYGNEYTAFSDQQPPATVPNVSNPPPWNGTNRSVTRTITYHYTGGWRVFDWKVYGSTWLGATFNLDLDGSLYQCEDIDVLTNHAGGTGYFTGTYTFANPTSVSMEIGRFGPIRVHSGVAPNRIFKVQEIPSIKFQEQSVTPSECTYEGQLNTNERTVGPCTYKLTKIHGGITLENIGRPYYCIKAAQFGVARHRGPTNEVWDVLYTEEQYQMMVAWGKSMCERYRIPKQFLRDPQTGRENPWIFVTDLVLNSANSTEQRERVRAFQGIIGHKNIQTNRYDPGASMDWYRIKRGISDEWWYPVILGDTTRAINYLDESRAQDYESLTEYNEPAKIEDYFAACEGNGGYFPIGRNRLWHGGIHLPSGTSARPVYAMANGRIVAARITSEEQVCEEPLPYSQCFVLIRHQVHVRDLANGEIDYGLNSTESVYSLYMHLQPLEMSHDNSGNFIVDYDAHPVWFNHYMIDHPDDTGPREGRIFYPDQPVLLSDHLGHTGNTSHDKTTRESPFMSRPFI